VDVSTDPLYEADPSSDRKGAQKAARSLAASVAKLHGAVPMPMAVSKLLAATESDTFDVPAVVRILEGDPGLAADLMRQVNSAGGAKVKCKSIAQAVTMLGQKSLREAAVAAAALEVFAADEAPVAQVIAHDGRRAAAAARALSRPAMLVADEMYMCALLHDVGQLMLLRGDDLDYPELLATTPAETLHLVERERYGFDHALLAGHVLLAWKLPQPICRTISWHHQPERAYASKGDLPRMVALVRVADRLARLPSEATADDVRAAIASMTAELQQLGWSEPQLPQLARDAMRALREADGTAPRPSMLPSMLPPTAPARVLSESVKAPAAAPATAPTVRAVVPSSPWLIALVFVGGAAFGRASGSAIASPLAFGVACLALGLLAALLANAARAK
jgi:HD-like signal output (HDOD) protein